jgi:hypothetical protein
VVLTALNVFHTIPPLSVTAIQPVPSHSHKTEIFFSVNDLISFYLLIAPLSNDWFWRKAVIRQIDDGS